MSLLEKELHIEEIDINLYRSAKELWRPIGQRGIFGGSVIAQALMAATKTVPPEFIIHSMHCYFVLSGNPDHPVLYHVERVRDGRSFATRTVQAKQRGRVIFTTTCSFQVDKGNGNMHHQSRMYEREVKSSGKAFDGEHEATNGIPAPESCVSSLEVSKYLNKQGVISDDILKKMVDRSVEDPIEIRLVTGLLNKDDGLLPHERRIKFWVRCKPVIERDDVQSVGIAYLSDSFLLGTAIRVQPLNPGAASMVVSLDHTIYFHGKFRADEWLLHVIDSNWSGNERALVRGRLYNQQGVLVATVFQEGVIRLKEKYKGKSVETTDDYLSSGVRTDAEKEESKKKGAMAAKSIDSKL